MFFAGYFLSVLFCLLSMLISDSRFDLVWFRLSCDHGWIRSGSVNVRKQQQQQQLPNETFPHQEVFFPIAGVTKSSTAKFSYENLIEKIKIFVQNFVPIRTALKFDFTVDEGKDQLNPSREKNKAC